MVKSSEISQNFNGPQLAFSKFTSANEENSEKSQEKNWHPGPSPACVCVDKI